MQTGIIKEGQVWVDFNGTKRTIEKNPTRTLFIWRGVTDAGTYSTYNDLGQYSGTASSYNDLKEMIMDVETNQDNLKSEPTKFVPPKPGDKIICNNGEEFVCCTLETLMEKYPKAIPKLNKPILSYKETGGYVTGWQSWYDNGQADIKVSNEFYDTSFDIKEIIPAQQEVKQEVTEVMSTQGDNTVGAVFQEKTYTLEQIKEAFDALQWYDDSFELLSDKLKETQDPEYKMYLELKAKFEGKE